MTEPNPFCSSLPTQLRAWDATSLRAYMECPRKYLQSIVQGWRLPGGIDVEWGRLYHASVEEWDKARATGVPKAEAMDTALAYALAHTGNYVEEAEAEGTPGLSPTRADLHFVPWDTGDNKKSRYTLLRAIVWYCDEQPENGGMEPYVFPDGRPAVELSFQLPLPLTNPDGEPYLLTGHLDGIAKCDAWHGVRERKTTKQTLGPWFFDQFQPDIQVDTYDLVGSVLFPELGMHEVLLEATQTAVGFARFHRHPLHNTEGKREEHFRTLLKWIKRAEQDARDHAAGDPDAYPMNKAACHAKGGCQFAAICGKDPSVRERYLAAGYIKQFWNPLAER